jgi:hypothetical protein
MSDHSILRCINFFCDYHTIEAFPEDILEVNICPLCGSKLLLINCKGG